VIIIFKIGDQKIMSKKMVEALALSLKQALINAVNSTNSKAYIKH